MINCICKECGKEFFTYPCRLKNKYGNRGLYCSKSCANRANWPKTGKNTCYKTGHKQTPEQIAKRIKGTTGRNHSSWKGTNVGYRGLHYWLRRHKGVPQICNQCDSTKNVQWASIDHKYRRNLNDYIPLCASCHKKYDLKRN